MHDAKNGKRCWGLSPAAAKTLYSSETPMRLRGQGPVWAPLCRSSKRTAHPAPVGHSPGPARDWAAVFGASISGCIGGRSQPDRVTGKPRPLWVGGELSSGLRASPRVDSCRGHLDTSTSVIPTRCEYVKKGDTCNQVPWGARRAQEGPAGQRTPLHGRCYMQHRPRKSHALHGHRKSYIKINLFTYIIKF